MNPFQKIKIDNQEYWIVDSIQNLRAEDSFIHRNNKLELFIANATVRWIFWITLWICCFLKLVQ